MTEHEWTQDEPTPGELWGTERLEAYARELGRQLTARRQRGRASLRATLGQAERQLREAYEAINEAIHRRRQITPAAEWLVDNHYVVVDLIKTLRDPRIGAQWQRLPSSRRVSDGDWPRIYCLAREYLARVNFEFETESFVRFLTSYQAIEPLAMRELWALGHVLQLALIDELRRLAVRTRVAMRARKHADDVANEFFAGDPRGPAARAAMLEAAVTTEHRAFVVHLAQRLQSRGTEQQDTLDWLANLLLREGLSIDAVTQREHVRRSNANLAVRNVFTSFRLLAALDWRVMFERTSPVERRLQGVASYQASDRRTRDRYRHCIEDLAEATGEAETEVADFVVRERERLDCDIGDLLIGRARHELEKDIGFRPSAARRLRRFAMRHARVLHLGSVVALTVALTTIAVRWALEGASVSPWLTALVALSATLPASEWAIGLISRQWMRAFRPRHLPRLALQDGLYESHRTLVVMPVILRTTAEAVALAQALQVHALANPDPQIRFALLSDWPDSSSPSQPGDRAILEAAVAAIADLNHGDRAASGDEPRFYLFHRRREWNPAECCYMGWERKRGKLFELNRLLLDKGPTTFMAVDGAAVAKPAGVRFVLTLDADSRLPLGAVRDLVAVAAHPLNAPVFDEQRRWVVEGYGLLQPRVTPLLPNQEEQSLYREIVTGGSGLDPYAAAVSDLYQDVFGEGLFTGKGLYDVAAFDRALDGRVPDNSMLSHDLFEGLFGRCALVADVEVYEDFPSHSEVAAARAHRWTRGDWQLLPWILGLRGRLPPLGRWKMLDNLRRSLLAPAGVLGVALALSIPGARSSVLLALIAMPWLWVPITTVLSRAVRSVVPRWSVAPPLQLVAEFGAELLRAAVNFGLLAQTAWLHVDAIARALFRLAISRRRRLEWMTAAQAKAASRHALSDFIWSLRGASIVVVTVSALILWLNPAGLATAAPILLLWWLSPVLARFLSRPLLVARAPKPPDAKAALRLRAHARLTWRYFERFVTAEDNFLPPDNFQESPAAVLAHRTSPTNVGLYLLACAAARDFGWISAAGLCERIARTFDTLDRLERHAGHFLNWYDTRTLAPLLPRYVSTVDSGNLAAHLLALARVLDEMPDRPLLHPDWRQAIDDGVTLFIDALARAPASDISDAARHQLLATVREMRCALHAPAADLSAVAATLGHVHRCTGELVRAVNAGAHPLPHRTDELIDFAQSLEREVVARRHDLEDVLPDDLTQQCTALRARALGYVHDMSFTFLFDRPRGLFSIGYRVAEGALDGSYYDLLASEARLASLLAIAKGDVPRSHWFKLGRRLTGGARRPTLASWSGSMFEYLMPALVMHEPSGSLLDRSCRHAIDHQIDYGEERGMPWGVSESAYNARDRQLTYQYSAFGVPALGLKRGLAAETVVAPYATALAAMYQPAAAERNLRRIDSLSGRGRFGFYEALDFTPRRRPDGALAAIVKCYMAHHQAMSIIALDNALHDRVMQRRFHGEPLIRSAELLLQERCPRFVDAPPLVEAESSEVRSTVDSDAHERILDGLRADAPATHLLSNRVYSVMLTESGSGYSHARGLAVHRWREDATCDASGSFIYVRDFANGRVWSVGLQPTAAIADAYEVCFREEMVRIRRRDGRIATTLETVVAGEDEGELRRVTLHNDSARLRELELTSYMEVVLAPQRADEAHPGFSNLFVRTEFDPRTGCLLAMRRPRSGTERAMWAAHAVIAGPNPVTHLEFETDRAKFVGRGRSVRTPLALTDGRPLSNTHGSVLDPILSLRVRVRLAPGESTTLSFLTFVAESREAAQALVVKYRHPGAFDQAVGFAWTYVRAELQHLQSDLHEAPLFQTLGGGLLYATRQLRASQDVLAAGTLDLSHLWRFSLSGDRPILLVRVRSLEELPFIRQCLRAQEYLRIKGLVADFVILGELPYSYSQNLRSEVAGLLATAQAELRGGVFVLSVNEVSAEEHRLLLSAARVVLSAASGTLAEQLRRVTPEELRAVRGEGGRRRTPSVPHEPADESRAGPGGAALEFANGRGGFDAQTGEYVIVLEAGRDTPAPWSNVIANERFGTLVTERGAMYTWCGNSRENQLTPWSNDPVTDASGEAIYLRDEESGELWSPTPSPIRIPQGRYEIRHGQGYSSFRLSHSAIDSELSICVAAEDPIKFCRVRLDNRSARLRRLTLAGYVEWLLGANRAASAPFVVTEMDAVTRAVFARNAANGDFGTQVAFADLGGALIGWTTDRREFLGRLGDTADPAALRHGAPWRSARGGGLDPCAALATSVELAPGETREVLFCIGQADSVDSARTLLQRYRTRSFDVVLAEVRRKWDDLLGAVTIRTPDRALDLLFNRWLLYQTIGCRLWARTGFYQAGGAYGFRDQLQDCTAVLWARPGLAREHLLRTAARQFEQGDVQHWWHPPSGRGVRTRFTDDRLWLVHATCCYLDVTGDAAVLDEVAPFITGAAVPPDREDAHYVPERAARGATLYEHCVRAIDISLQFGAHGLPLMGGGDWNDGMNRVGLEGRGESVWLAWFLIDLLKRFAPVAEARADTALAARWRASAAALADACEGHGWDGAWYRRAFFDDGTPLGSAANDECRIDSLAQSWAVLCGAADPGRAGRAMQSVEEHLVRSGDGLVLLFTPPFDRSDRDPGYVKGYLPGLRENGAHYSHAAVWVLMAQAMLGDCAQVGALLEMLNPIRRSDTRSGMLAYRVEPYVLAADIYSGPDHARRGGWTWYTGASAWLYRAVLESVLGLRVRAATLAVRPCMPPHWNGFEAELRFGADTRYGVEVRRVSPGQIVGATLDGAPCDPAGIPLRDDGFRHSVRVVVG